MHDSSSASSVGGGVNRQDFQQWLDGLPTEEVNRLCSLKLEELADHLDAYPRSLLNRVSVVESVERRDGADAENQDIGIFSRVINLFSAVYSYFVAPEEPEEQQGHQLSALDLTEAQKALKMTQRARFIDSLNSWVSEDGLDDEERAARTEAAEKLRTNFNTQAGELNPAWPECVESIDLSLLPIRSLPPCLGVFTHLQSLVLSFTQIHALPPEIGNLLRLERLYLHGVPIDSLPGWIGKLVQLQFLNLSRTKIRELPSEIGNLTRLMCLNLCGLPIDSLPDSIGKLLQLRILNLSRTKIRELPSEISHLVQLEYLDLDGVPIDSLPDWIGTLVRLIDLMIPPDLIADPAVQTLRQNSMARLAINGVHVQEPGPAAPQHLDGISEFPLDDPNLDEGEFYLDEAAMHDNPMQVLREFATFLVQVKEDLPATWSIKVPNAVDAGGVKRELVCCLVHELFNSSGNGERLHYMGYPPAIRPAIQDGEQLEDFQRLGNVLALPLRYPAPVGALFDQGVYAALAAAFEDNNLRQDTEMAHLKLGRFVYSQQKSLLERMEGEGLESLSADEQEAVFASLANHAELAQQARAFCIYHQDGMDPLEAVQRAYLVSKDPDLGQFLAMEPDQPVTLSVHSRDLLLQILVKGEPDLIPELLELFSAAQVASERLIDERLHQLEERAAATQNVELKKALEGQITTLRAQRKSSASNVRVADPDSLGCLMKLAPALQSGIPQQKDFLSMIAALKDKKAFTARVIEAFQAELATGLLAVGKAIQRISLGILEALPSNTNPADLAEAKVKKAIEGVANS